MNLVINARDATPKGGKITLAVTNRGGEVGGFRPELSPGRMSA